MNTFELLEGLRSAPRDNLHSIVMTVVFEDDPKAKIKTPYEKQTISKRSQNPQ